MKYRIYANKTKHKPRNGDISALEKIIRTTTRKPPNTTTPTKITAGKWLKGTNRIAGSSANIHQAHLPLTDVVSF